jgi:predicted RNA binding protein YcfA (HicA-like mRNA interferase family)
MSSRLPRLTAKEAILVVEKAGFTLMRQSGSHMIFKNGQGKRITIPYHTGDTLHPKIIQSIIRDSGLTTEEFLEKM